MSSKTKSIILVLILVVAVAGLVMGMRLTASRNPARGPDVGNKAPEFALVNLDNQVVALGNLRGQPVMVNFWATWCPSCRQELPLIQATAANQLWKDNGLMLLGIDIAEPASTVKDFVQKNNLTFPVLRDSNRDVSLEYGVVGIPMTFFIDQEGIIRDIKIGPFADMQEIENGLNKIVR